MCATDSHAVSLSPAPHITDISVFYVTSACSLAVIHQPAFLCCLLIIRHLLLICKQLTSRVASISLVLAAACFHYLIRLCVCIRVDVAVTVVRVIGQIGDVQDIAVVCIVLCVGVELGVVDSSDVARSLFCDPLQRVITATTEGDVLPASDAVAL